MAPSDLSSSLSPVEELGSTAPSATVLDLFSKLSASEKQDVAAFITANLNNAAVVEQSSLLSSTVPASSSSTTTFQSLGQAGAAVLAVRGVKRAFRGGSSSLNPLQQQLDEIDVPQQDDNNDDQDEGPTQTVANAANGLFGHLFSGISAAFGKVFQPLVHETKQLQAEQDAAKAQGATDADLALIPPETKDRFLAWEKKFIDYCQSHTYTVTFGILCFLFFYYIVYQWAWKSTFSFILFVCIYGFWAYNRVYVQQIQTLDDLEIMLKQRFLLAFEESRVWVQESVKTLYAWFFFFLPFLHDLWLSVAPYLYLYGSALKQWYLALPTSQQWIADGMFVIFLIAFWQLLCYRAHLRRLWRDNSYRNNVYYAF